jgi:hypothetical protein
MIRISKTNTMLLALSLVFMYPSNGITGGVSLPVRKTKAAKKRVRHHRQSKTSLGYVIDAYRGKMPVLQIGEAGDGELAYKVSRSGDIGADWKDESEVVGVHLTAAGKKEAARIRRLIRRLMR